MIHIGPHRFLTKKVAETHFRALLARHPFGVPVIGPDHDDLMSLIHV